MSATVHRLSVMYVCLRLLLHHCVCRHNIGIPMCLITNKMHSSYNHFLFHSFFCLLYMFRTNLVVHHQKHGIMYCVIQYIMLCS